VKNVFLHGALEEMYTEIPIRFETHNGRKGIRYASQRKSYMVLNNLQEHDLDDLQKQWFP